MKGRITTEYVDFYFYYNGRITTSDKMTLLYNQNYTEFLRSLHRDDNGPNLIHTNGVKRWYKNGVLHREDGPAIVWRDGEYSWFWKGISFDNFDGWINAMPIPLEDKVELKLKLIDLYREEEL